MSFAELLNYTDFANIKLDLPFTVTGGDTFEVASEPTLEGEFNSPVAANSTPIFRGSLRLPVLDHDQYMYLTRFFALRRGQQQGFRFRNPLDHKAYRVAETYAAGISQSAVLINQSPTKWAIYKQYKAGLNIRLRRIRLVNDITVYAGSDILNPSQWQLTDNGFIRIPSGQTTVNYSCDVDFDLPVNFASDSLSLTPIAQTADENIEPALTANNTVTLTAVANGLPAMPLANKSTYSLDGVAIVENPLLVPDPYTFLYGYRGQTVNFTVQARNGLDPLSPGAGATYNTITLSCPTTAPILSPDGVNNWRLKIYYSSPTGFLDLAYDSPQIFNLGAQPLIRRTDAVATNGSQVYSAPINALNLPYNVRDAYL